MRSSIRRAVLILGLAVLVAAPGAGCRCGSNQNPSDAGVLPDGFAEYIEAVCDWAVDCQGTFGPAFASRDSCVAFYDDLFSCFLVPFFEAFGLELTTDPAALDACLDAIAAAGCNTAMIPESLCGDLFVKTGTGAAGDSCATGGITFSGACMTGLYCDYQPGVCSACAPEAVLNEDCTDRPCADGLWCDFTMSTCAALLSNGSACTFDSECQSDVCEMDVCSPPLADGSPCSSDSDCASGACALDVCVAPGPEGSPCMADEECDGFRACLGGVCADRLPTGAACTGSGCLLDHVCTGGVCTPVDGCETIPFGISCGAAGVCTGAEYCDGNTMTCEARVPVGSPCGNDGQCAGDAHCDDVSMTCADPSPAGGPCTFDSDCQKGLRCASDDTCFTPAANGAPCTMPDECESEYCDAASSVCADLPACP